MPIPFHKTSIAEDDIAEVVDSLRSGWLTMGPKTIRFEQEFSRYISQHSDSAQEYYALSVNSCTSGLHLALKAIGLQAGDEVIIPTNTFIATAEVVTYFGAIPVLCDIEAHTHNLDVRQLPSLLTSKTKAIIPVHFAGHPCDMDEILSFAEKHHLFVIEDAAHALPSFYKKKLVGTLGHITCFSFYATKTLCTGEGGMVVCSNEEFYKKMKVNRLHGMSRDAWDRYTLKGAWFYEIIDNGYKYNTTDLNAALGISQLKKLEIMNQRRKDIAAIYNTAFVGTQVVAPGVKERCDSCWHLYVIKVNNRDELVEKLKENGIGASVHFIPVHMHPYYKTTYEYDLAKYPVANDVFARSLSLPIYPDMKDEEVKYVCEMVLKYAK